MVNITEVRKKDYFRIENAYKSLLFLLRLESATYYETIHSVYNLYDEYNNRNFLFIGDNSFYIVDTSFEFADKVIFCKTNELNNIVGLIPSKSNVIIEAGNVVRLDVNNNHLEEIVLIHNEEVCDYRNINAALLYAQFNYKEALRCTLFNHYEANFDGTDKISDSSFNLPFLITFDQFVKVIDKTPKIIDSYYLAEWDPSINGYALALMKAYGVKSFINRRKEQLNFERYYKEPVIVGDEVSLISLLRNKGYSLDDMKNILSCFNYGIHVPKDLIDMFNGQNRDYQFCYEVKDLICSMDYSNNVKKY